MNNSNIAIGRRKSSVARVRLVAGDGAFFINNIPGDAYLQFNPKYIDIVKKSLTLLNVENNFNIHVNAQGGGLTGQAEAISLGVSRLLSQSSADNRSLLKAEGCLKRDARVKERKKYGLRKARKAPQYSKR